MATGVLVYPPLIGEQYEDGDKLYVYQAGTTTPVTAYQEYALSTAHTSPIVADSTGRFAAIYLSSDVGNVKIVVTDSNDVQRYSQDNVPVTDLTAISDDVDTLDTQYTSLNGRLTTAESEIDTLQTESTDYESRIATLEGVSTNVQDSDFTGANQSLSASGFQKLPGGLILQWGSANLVEGPETNITFPEAFTTACYNVQATANNALTKLNNPELWVHSITTTGFTCGLSHEEHAHASGLDWFAVGK